MKVCAQDVETINSLIIVLKQESKWSQPISFLKLAFYLMELHKKISLLFFAETLKLFVLTFRTISRFFQFLSFFYEAFDRISYTVLKTENLFSLVGILQLKENRFIKFIYSEKAIKITM